MGYNRDNHTYEIHFKKEDTTFFMPVGLFGKFPDKSLKYGQEFMYKIFKDDEGNLTQNIKRSRKRYPIPKELEELLK